MQRKVGRVAALLATAFACLTQLGCTDTGEPSPEHDAIDGWQRGELEVFISDDPDGRSETSYYLRDTRAGAPLDTRLLFDHTSRAPVPELLSGVRVRVRGVETPDGLRVIDYQILRDDAASTITSALIGAAPYPTRNMAMVLVNLNGLGVNTTADTVNSRLTGAADSIKNYYLYDSYGMQDINAQVFGPINYNMTSCSNSDASRMSSDLRPMINGTFQHYLWYIGQTRSGGSPCTWGGLGSVGSPQSPARDTWYNGSSSCIVLVQEPGHNFGMQHSSSMACGTNAAFLDDPNQCTYSEYGDRFDPMGNGCRHMNAWQKQYQGWFGGCNGVRVYRSGTFTLLPLEAQCNGVQFLQIKMPKTRAYNRPAGGGGNAGVDNLDWYYLELRTPLDFDGTLGNGTNTLSPRVLVHAGTNPRTRTQTGMHTYLLDMNPSTTGTSGLNDAGLAMGQTFNDPAGGLSFTTTALSATSATITVTFANDSGAAPTCLDNSAFTTPGPVDCGTGMGGRGGSGGTGGSGGAGGRGGAGGTGGVAGTGGSGGRGGAGGTGGGGGSAGTGGSGGVAGTGGSAGSGGRGGAGGTAGTGGVAGTGGSAGGRGGAGGTDTGGVGGTAGTGGVAGTGGSAAGSGGSAAGSGGSSAGAGGTAGAAGDGGTAGTGGGGGEGGSAGTAGTTGAAGAGPGGKGGKGGDITGGCDCQSGGGAPTPLGVAFMAALAAVAIGRVRPGGRRSRAQASSRSSTSTTSGGSK